MDRKRKPNRYKTQKRWEATMLPKCKLSRQPEGTAQKGAPWSSGLSLGLCVSESMALVNSCSTNSVQLCGCLWQTPTCIHPVVLAVGAAREVVLLGRAVTLSESGETSPPERFSGIYLGASQWGPVPPTSFPGSTRNPSFRVSAAERMASFSSPGRRAEPRDLSLTQHCKRPPHTHTHTPGAGNVEAVLRRQALRPGQLWPLMRCTPCI